MEGKREVQEGEDMGIFMADSCCCMPETNCCKAVLLQFFKKKYCHCIGISKGEIEIHVFLKAVSTFKEEKSRLSSYYTKKSKGNKLRGG